MKKALLTAALLVAPFFSQANIYDLAASPVNPTTTRGCDTPQSPSQAIAQYNSDNNLPINAGTWYQDARKLVRVVETYFDQSSSFCSIFYEYRSSGGTINSDGTRVQTYNTTQQTSIGGTQSEVPQCINLGNNPDGTPAYPDHSHLGKDSSGTSYCYNPQDLADVDTCEINDENGNPETFISDFGGASCMPKSDGSVCPVKPSEVSEISTSDGTTVYFYKADNSDQTGACYNSQEAVEKPNTFNENMPTSGCDTIGGIEYCSELSQNVCDGNGNCAAGCGMVTSGGTTNVVCATPDFDGDGVPDYQDPDRDGDGIPNEQDLDNDNDGIDDAVTGYTGTTSQSLGRIEGLLSQIAQNSGGGSGGGSGASASQIGESVGEEVKEKLTELGDFSTADYENRVNDKITASNEAIDQFLEADESDLTNAFDESEYQSSFSTFKGLLSSSGCTAQFSIPLTGQNLDMCEAASRTQPFLYVIFAVSTFIYCVRRIQQTARAE